MSVNIKQANGTLQKVAGNTILLDATASEIRSGTFTQSVPASSYSTQVITFDIPMPDNEYLIEITANQSTLSGIQPQVANKTTTGFTCMLFNNYAQAYTPSFSYNAVRLVKLDGYTEVQNKVNNPDSAPTENSTNLVTSGGVYDAIKNRGISEHFFLGTGVYDRPYLPRTITINKTGHNAIIVTPHMGSDNNYQSNYTPVVFDISSQLYLAGTKLNAVFPSYDDTTQTISWSLVHFADVTAVTQDTLTLSTEGVTTGYPWFHIHVI